ncbi:phosphoglycolate phosphatase [Comamonas aquatica]|jgi:phosphoglycolate phosphatase|uniref:Phosphoglycolate phosphatase n=1 Tax=Comamonas aquatica TaxID=225991 RepID=A0AA42HSL3_9BURK|nr:phosphoglycolate phosphatase [Comamonas aquatica]ANY61247.1 phosphoglycolate phosphatase, bacterial [Comamonas aquatica]MDH0199631.1 phosphoglycolate phosphatase [Comamonas aquatica]MDH0363760.1 phosphoglycolate phosphatase [Comamonas aquatica]MDH0899160.1 phosphoglycolate phosphatase [Comamonas aquatica]MDH1378297.1 phosphoglycolate phosphatase [Comamonas aquatica]
MSVQVTVGAQALHLEVDAAIVDLDGTMVDTIGDFAEAIARMLADLQLPALDAALIEHMVGKGTEHLLRSVLAHVLAQAGHSADALPAAVARLLPTALARYEQHYLAINGQHSALYAGVLEGLQALRAGGLRLACVTNKPLAFTRPLLAAKGLQGLFEQVFGGDSFATKKPDPLPLLKTCEALGTTPARTLMLGDSSNDAQAARAAGCPVVLVTYGYNHGQSVEAVGADALIDSIAQLRVV